MPFNRILVVLLVCAAGIFTAGCGGRHDSNEKYYLVATNIKLGYWQTASAGFIQAARDMEVPAESVGPDTYDPQAQVAEFRRVVAQKPSGILISASDADLLRPEIDSAIAQGIPVVTMDSDAAGSKRLFFIGTDNYQAGQMGAEIAVKAMGGKGNVVVFTIAGQSNLAERLNGYRSVLDRSAIKITRVVDMKGDPRVAFDTTTNIVNKKEAVDGFVCLEAMGGKEVAAVLEQNNVQGKVVVAMDTDQDTLDWIKRGRIVATVGQKPYTMGYVGISMLDNIHHNRPTSLTVDWKQDGFAIVPAFVDTGAVLVTSENLAAFQAAQQKVAPGTAKK